MSKRQPESPPDKFPEISPFAWNEQRSNAAIALAAGKTQDEVAAEVECDRKTLYNWLCNNDFAAEVDRLSLMVDVASRAARLRLAMRVVRQRTAGNEIKTDKDLLDWLKFAQSETDGVKLDLSKLAAAFAENDAPLAGGRSAGEAEHQESVN